MIVLDALIVTMILLTLALIMIVMFVLYFLTLNIHMLLKHLTPLPRDDVIPHLCIN